MALKKHKDPSCQNSPDWFWNLSFNALQLSAVSGLTLYPLVMGEMEVNPELICK